MAVHELFLLHLGQLGMRDEATGEAHFNQVPGYLIRTASGMTVLVDSGNPRAMIGADDAEPWARLLTNTRAEDDVVPRLAELGIAPADVGLLVSTHFDFDHCGRHDVFAAAGTESVVQRRHLAAARKERRYDRSLWDLPGLRYREVDGDVELEPGLRLLSTSGHAIGHQSVYVETAGGPVILAVDAISRGDTIQTREIPDWYSDVEEAARSMDRLVALAGETGAYLIFGHDAAQWDALPKSPAPYRRP
ncbi:MAG TPA: N-acyl homoserine lactonase family protein [Thermomicrobiales bacterium]|nr:N-acyl homoserine lactonase family protein [Thermomicrobiales bacterium]